MKIKNQDIKDFISFLLEFELSGKKSRMRTRFCKLLNEQLSLVDEEKHLLINQYGERDSDGNLVATNVEEGSTTFRIENKEEFLREFNILMNEYFYIDETLERKDMLLLIKEVVLDCELSFKGKQALIYDNWCEMVEEIKYE